MTQFIRVYMNVLGPRYSPSVYLVLVPLGDVKIENRLLEILDAKKSQN